MQTTVAPTGTIPATQARPRRLPRILAQGLLALESLLRERADLRALDGHMLRDIGVTRADVEQTLGSPATHLRLILLRGGQ